MATVFDSVWAGAVLAASAALGAGAVSAASTGAASRPTASRDAAIRFIVREPPWWRCTRRRGRGLLALDDQRAFGTDAGRDGAATNQVRCPFALRAPVQSPVRTPRRARARLRAQLPARGAWAEERAALLDAGRRPRARWPAFPGRGARRDAMGAQRARQRAGHAPQG